ncbi:hypothetical protein AC578_1455 [Pseudocercospora eumusae]|uniref:Ig-like domain-containing protein n=1 Tax=Pseudocercospora eumusae TaxID=321146 RepID=A0A139GUD9_9PEZI|nr:hypothetical protein AC578_1455 [Pseudocercospora eumusae]
MAVHSIIALLVLGGSCLFARAAPQPAKPVILLRPVTSTLPPGDPHCPDKGHGCIVEFTTLQSVTTVTNIHPGPSPSTVATQTPEPSVTMTSESSSAPDTSTQSTSTSTAPVAPVAPSLPSLSTGATAQLTSPVQVIPSIAPPFANTTSSSWSILTVPTSSGLLPTTSSHSSRLTSAVPSGPSVPLPTSDGISTARSTSVIATSTSEVTSPVATSSVLRPEDTSRSVVVSTHVHTETLTTKTTTTNTEYPPVTSVIESTLSTTSTETITTTTTDQPLVLSSCGLGGIATDGQPFFTVCQSTFETSTFSIVPPSSTSVSAILDPLETSTTCTDETSKTGPADQVTAAPSISSVLPVPHPETPCHHDSSCHSVPIIATNSSTSLSTLSFSSSEPKTTAAGLGFTTICDSPHHASQNTTACSVISVISSTEPFIPKDPNTVVPPEEHSEYSKTHIYPTSTFLHTSASSFTTITSSVTRHEV